MSKSKSIDLVEKKYDSKLSGKWIGLPTIHFIFSELYIKKHYSKLLHYIPYVELSISKYNKTSKNLYEFDILDFNTYTVYNERNNKKDFLDFEQEWN